MQLSRSFSIDSFFNRQHLVGCFLFAQGAKLLFILEKIELTPFFRVRGSHHFFFNPVSKKTASVPVHGNEYLSPGLLKEVLRDIDLSVEEYEKLRQKV